MALGLSWSSLVYFGFAQFVTALPLGFFAIAALLRSASPGGTASDARRAAVLGALAFVSHPLAGVPFLATALVRSRATGPLRTLAIVAPCLVLVALWLGISPAGQEQLATLEESGLDRRYQTTAEALSTPATWLADILKGSGDLRRFGAWCLVVLLGVAVGQGVPALGLALVAGGLLLLYAVAPLAQGWIWPLAPRFLVVGALLFTALLPFPRRGFARWGLGLAHVVIACVAVFQVGQRFQRFGGETGSFAEALQCVPREADVVAWLPDSASDHVRYWPYTHFGAYVQAERGGTFAFSFASHPSAPVGWRRDPPEVPSNGFQPGRADPAEVLQPFDVVVVRGDDARIEEGEGFGLLCAGSPWSVWRIDDSGVPAQPAARASRTP